MAGKRSSGFGRGWIPAERDIGLPNDPVAAISGRYAPFDQAEGAARGPSAPLPPAGGAGGGAFEIEYVVEDEVYDFAYPPTPSRLREGEQVRATAFTPARQVQFLHHLAAHGNVRLACAKVGLSAQAAYVHKRRDAALAQGWEAALVLARDAAEQVLADRALNGTRETIFYRGEAVGHRVRYDSRLLLAHMARLDKHYDEAERGRATAGRFDEFLDALLSGEADAAELAEGGGEGAGVSAGEGWGEGAGEIWDDVGGWTPSFASRAQHIAEELAEAEQTLRAELGLAPDDDADDDADDDGPEADDDDWDTPYDEQRAGKLDVDEAWRAQSEDDDAPQSPEDLAEALARAEQLAEKHRALAEALARTRAEAAAVWDAAAAERYARIDALTAEDDWRPAALPLEVKSLPEEVLWPKWFPWTLSTVSTWPPARRAFRLRSWAGRSPRRRARHCVRRDN